MAIYHSPDHAGRVEFSAALLRQKKHMHWCLKEPFDNLASLLQQKEHRRKAESVRTLRSNPSISRRQHPFEDVTASYHPLGIAGKVAGKSSNTQWAFRQLWKQVRNLTGATSAVSLSLSAMRTHSGIFSSSVLSLSRDSHDVAAPGDCSSAIIPKVQHRPMFLPAISFLVKPIGFLGIDSRQDSGGTAPLTGSR